MYELWIDGEKIDFLFITYADATHWALARGYSRGDFTARRDLGNIVEKANADGQPDAWRIR
jgi:hypothetical protein